MKKFTKEIFALTITAAMIFSITACDGPHFQEQPDQPSVNEVSTETPEIENGENEVSDGAEISNENDENNVSDNAESSDFYAEEPSEYPPVGESYVELLYSRYFQFSYSMFSPEDMFYKDRKVTVEDITSRDKKAFAFEIFWERDGRIDLYDENGIEDFYYYNAELLEARVKSLFGPAAKVDKNSFAGSSSIAFNYNSLTGDYVGYSAMGGDEKSQFKNELVSYEQKGEFLYIYDKIMFIPTEFIGYDSIILNDGIVINTPVELPWSWYTKITDEFFEQNCVTYKHTFKRNSDDSYYWISSEPSDESGTKTVTAPMFTDDFAEELYKKYFTCRASLNYLTEDMFFSKEIRTVKNLSNAQKQAIVWFVGGEYLGFASEDGSIVISKEDFEAKLKQYLGDDATVEHADFSTGGYDFTYDANKAQYVGNAASSTTPTARSLNKYGEFELDGEYLYLYDEYLYVVYDSVEPNSEGKYQVTYYNNNVDTYYLWANQIAVNSCGPQVDDTFLNLIGVTYKHTFKQNADGNYYWVSSKPIYY